MFSISFNEDDKQLISLLKNMTEFLTNRYYQNMTIKYIDYSEEEEAIVKQYRYIKEKAPDQASVLNTAINAVYSQQKAKDEQ